MPARGVRFPVVSDAEHASGSAGTIIRIASARIASAHIITTRGVP